MSVYPWWIAYRRAIAAGLATAVVVGALLYAYVATRPPQYQARFALLATPLTRASTGNVDLGTMVALTLPSLTQLARSPAVLERVAGRVRDAPGIDQLAGQITVELVPNSGFARITVQDSSPGRASLLAAALSSEIRHLDLLGPVGVFRTYDSGAPIAEQTSPDLVLGAGFALAGGAIAGLLVGSLLAVRRPRLIGRRQAAAIVNNPNVPILIYGAHEEAADGVRWLLARMTVIIVPVGDEATEATNRISGKLVRTGEESGRPDTPGADTGVVLVAVMGRTTPEELSNSCAVLRASRSTLVALALV